MKHIGIKIAIFLNYFVFAALLNSVGILVERSQEIYGVAKADAAILEPFKDLSIAIISFIAGSFLTKLGYKRALLISLFLVFIGCIGMYFGNSFWSVKILFACTGISFAVVKVSIFALIGFITDSKKGHSQLMSLIETVFMLGIIFMYVVFPLFYSETDPNNWLKGYLFMAVFLAISFIIIALSKFDIHVEPSKNTISENLVNMFKMFSKPIIYLFAIFAFFYVMTEQGIMTWLPTFNKETLHIDSKLATQMAVLLMTSFALGRFLTGFIVKFIKWEYIAMAGVICAGILVLTVLPLAKNIPVQQVSRFNDLPLVSFLFPLIGLFLAPIYPLVNSSVLSATDKSIHSELAGILTFFSAIGGTIGSLIIGKLFDKLGGDNVFYLSLIPLCCILIIILLIAKKNNTHGIST